MKKILPLAILVSAACGGEEPETKYIYVGGPGAYTCEDIFGKEQGCGLDLGGSKDECYKVNFPMHMPEWTACFMQESCDNIKAGICDQYLKEDW